MRTLADAFIAYLNQIGVFSFFIPLLLVWTVLYLILVNVPPFKEDKYRSIASLVSLLVASVIVMFPVAVRTLQYATVFVALFIFFSAFVFIFYSFIGASSGDKNNTLQSMLTGLIRHRLFQILLLISFAVMVIFAANLALSEYTGGGYIPLRQILEGNYTDPYYAGSLLISHPSIIGSVIILILIGIFMFLMTFSPSSGGTGSGGS